MKRILFGLSAVLFTGVAQAADAPVAIGEAGTKVGAGIVKTTKNSLNAEAGKMFGVGNSSDVAGMVYFNYSTLAGSTLPGTIQPGVYTFSARVGKDGNLVYSGLNDISTGTNSLGGSVAGFFTTLNASDVTVTKNNMYTEFNAISGVAYTAPTEADPADNAWTTWTFTWIVAEGSPVIGTDPYFAVYTRTGAGGGGNGYWDDSILTFIPSGAGNIPPVAENQDITMLPNASINITLSGTDIEGSNLTYEVTGFPSNGALVTNGALPNLTYTPDTDYQGVDSFTFLINDGESNSAPATVAITVTNKVPTADAQSVVTFADTDLDITLSGSDPDNGPSSLSYSYADPTNGTLSGTAPNLTYTPASGYVGGDGFTFTVSDGLATSAVATVSITVNEAPAATGTISVNFHVGNDADAQDDHELTGAEAAGLDNNTFWNNINVGPAAGSSSPGTIFPSTMLTNDAGTSAATIAPSTNSSWFVGYAASAASVRAELGLPGNHDDLFNSYLALNGPDGDGTPADAAVLEITGLGDAYTNGGYNLIIYSDSDRRNTGTNNRRSEFMVVGGGSTNTVFVEDDDLATTVNIFDGTYIMSDLVEDGPDYSNYTVVSNLTAGSFTISIYSDDGGRGAISGFQIVPNSTPAIENFGVEMVSGEVVLSWDGGGTYNVMTNQDLVYPNWGVAEPDASSPITIGIGREPQLFYKLSN